MPTEIYPDPYKLARAWRTKDGISITEIVGREAKRRRLHLDGMVTLIKSEPIEKSQLAIAHHRCQILPVRLGN